MEAFWPVALLPIALLTWFMVVRRWPAWKAGLVGYLSALVLAAYPFRLPLQGYEVAHARAFFLWVDVVLIISGAYLFFQVVREAGVFQVLAEYLPRLTTYREMHLLILGWAFPSFIQGTGGLGVPMAVAAPLLIGLGFDPMVAAVVAALGHGWAVTFGSLGTPYRALLATTGLPAARLAPQAAWTAGVAGIGTGLVILYLYRGWRAVLRLGPAALFMGLVMAATLIGVVRMGLWPLGSMLAGLAGMAAGLLVALWQRQGNGEAMHARDWQRVALALVGYVVLVLLILVTQVWARDLLSQWRWRPYFPAVQTGLGYTLPAGPGRPLYPLRHPGLTLYLATLLAYLLYRRYYDPGATQAMLRSTARQVLRVSVAVFFIVSMALVMYVSGMTTTLARVLAQASGPWYGLLATWLGAFGGFLTGSNLNSNVLFAGLQMQTAQMLRLSVPVILAAQATGGGVGSVIAPTKVLVGTATTGLYGQEGAVIRRMALGIFLVLLLVSLWTQALLRQTAVSSEQAAVSSQQLAVSRQPSAVSSGQAAVSNGSTADRRQPTADHPPLTSDRRLPTAPPSWSRPPRFARWQIQFTGPLQTNLDVEVFDLDLFDVPAQVIQGLRARGVYVMCYFSAGSWEDWRPDAHRFPQEVLGKPLENWPGERWLDIRRLDVLAPLMEARLDLAAAKGCQGVDPDNVNGFENDTGFPLTPADQLRFNRYLAQAAHRRGLAIGLKNDLAQIPQLVHDFDWELNEECFYYGECEALLPFVRAGKPVFVIEYESDPATFCPKALDMGFNALKKRWELDAFRIDCRER